MVKPIATLQDIDRIRQSLRNSPRDLLLFDLATQTGCNMQKALKMKVRDMIGRQAGDFILADQDPLENGNKIIMTRRLHRSFNNYLKVSGPGEDEFIFKSRKGKGVCL